MGVFLLKLAKVEPVLNVLACLKRQHALESAMAFFKLIYFYLTTVFVVTHTFHPMSLHNVTFNRKSTRRICEMRKSL